MTAAQNVCQVHFAHWFHVKNATRNGALQQLTLLLPSDNGSAAVGLCQVLKAWAKQVLCSRESERSYYLSAPGDFAEVLSFLLDALEDSLRPLSQVDILLLCLKLLFEHELLFWPILGCPYPEGDGGGIACTHL